MNLTVPVIETTHSQKKALPQRRRDAKNMGERDKGNACPSREDDASFREYPLRLCGEIFWGEWIRFSISGLRVLHLSVVSNYRIRR
jgi:hypothetical protein